jgi:NAD(P)-dependent dehydrogenase (short-subunit alcohol dehydrogenase family)
MPELTGQVAIVTGGGTGFGRAIAEVLAMAGAAVMVVGRRAGELGETVARITAGGGQAMAFPADITDWDAMQQLVTTTEAQFGPVDLLVNNAGAVNPLAPLWELDPEEWRRNVEVNLTGTVLCMRAVLPGMVARQRGRIITISSHGIKGPVPYFAAYASTKLAVVKVMETLAVEVRERWHRGLHGVPRHGVDRDAAGAAPLALGAAGLRGRSAISAEHAHSPGTTRRAVSVPGLRCRQCLVWPHLRCGGRRAGAGRAGR